MVKLVDTADLKSADESCTGSIPVSGTSSTIEKEGAGNPGAKHRAYQDLFQNEVART
jgi:hypothetical protein